MEHLVIQWWDGEKVWMCWMAAFFEGCILRNWAFFECGEVSSAIVLVMLSLVSLLLDRYCLVNLKVHIYQDLSLPLSQWWFINKKCSVSTAEGPCRVPITSSSFCRFSVYSVPTKYTQFESKPVFKYQHSAMPVYSVQMLCGVEILKQLGNRITVLL